MIDCVEDSLHPLEGQLRRTESLSIYQRGVSHS